MAKVTRILALLTIVALVAALPMSVVAQNDAPHVFIGTAIVNGLDRNHRSADYRLGRRYADRLNYR